MALDPKTKAGQAAIAEQVRILLCCCCSSFCDRLHSCFCIIILFPFLSFTLSSYGLLTSLYQCLKYTSSLPYFLRHLCYVLVNFAYIPTCTLLPYLGKG